MRIGMGKLNPQVAQVLALESRTLLAAGALDPSFGSDGIVLTDFEGAAAAHAVTPLPLPDGRIVAIGQAGAQFNNGRITAVRFLPNGKADATFGIGGVASFNFNGLPPATDAARLSDGKILIAGTLADPMLVSAPNAD